MVDVGWLRGLGEEGLAALLERRPEAVAGPEPRALSELAERLVEPGAVVAAMRRLDRPTLQVAEAVAALGGDGVDPAAVQRLLGAADDPAVERALATLAGHALLTRSGGLTLVEPARYAFGPPLGLGPPLAGIVAGRTADELRVVARNLDVRPPTRKAEIIAAVVDALRDPDRVRSIVGAAPARVREFLQEVARTGQAVQEHLYFSPRYSEPRTPSQWALARGLLVRASDWEVGLLMPAEVALALRGPGWTAPFEPVPPRLDRIPVQPSLVDREAIAAAASLLRSVTALLDEAGRKPVALLRTGGVGVRELRRLGKGIGCPAAEVKLALAVAHQAGLLGWSSEVLAATPEYDRWLGGEPPQRLTELLTAWWSLPYVPLVEPDAPWVPGATGGTDARLAVLAEVAREPATAAADPASLAALVAWRRPYGLGAADPTAHLAAAWREATMVGAVGAGAISAAGQALLRGDDSALQAAVAGVGTAMRTVRLQADLTAVVTGTPSAELCALLDSVADRESAGTASIWRFSPASVRRALDAGLTSDALLDSLAGAAPSGVPQPLGYLLRDVARRHGTVRGRDVACCLRSEDTALLAEIAADRRLRALGLRTLAPTVLAGAKPLDQTLALLRAAGYAPVTERADGTAEFEAGATRRVASPAVPHRPAVHRQREAPAPPDRPALARRLLGRSNTAMATPSDTLRIVRGAARQLTESQARVLAHAIERGEPVAIEYVSQRGVLTRRVIEEVVLSGGSLTAWCQLRQDDREFALRRVRAVTAV